jgi:hypothetical protein
MDLPKLLNGKTIAELLMEGDGPSAPMLSAVDFLSILGGGLWHTTSLPRYQGILKSGAILPEPTIPDSERWKTAAGSKHYPFVRFLGGVSLFDFKDFDSASYEITYPLSSWREFVPYRQEWGAAVWIEIDRLKSAKAIVGAQALVEKWNKEMAHGHTLMPMLEAAHIGPISTSSMSRAILVDGKTGKTETLGGTAS